MFCKACADNGCVPSGCYRGDWEEYVGQKPCADCPRCACGTRLSEHIDLSPCHVFHRYSLVWAPECYVEYKSAMKELDHGTL